VRDAAAGNRWAKQVVASRILETPTDQKLAPAAALPDVVDVAVSAQPAKVRHQAQLAARAAASQASRRKRNTVKARRPVLDRTEALPAWL